SIGEFSFFSVWVATTIGSLVGACFLYSIGHVISKEGIEKLVLRFGKFVGIKQRELFNSLF
ncbi:MAG: DedA family protein, partial [Actinomycetota bacterium]